MTREIYKNPYDLVVLATGMQPNAAGAHRRCDSSCFHQITYINGMDTESDLAHEAILEAVENQIRDKNPPITGETLNRLIGDGYTRAEAMKLIAFALANEVSEIMNSNQPFSEERYTQNLKNLPAVHWEE